MLGRILPDFFPSIFGEDEKQPLDAEASKQALKNIADQVNEQGKASGQPDKSVEEVWNRFAPMSPLSWPCLCIIDIIVLHCIFKLFSSDVSCSKPGCNAQLHTRWHNMVK